MGRCGIVRRRREERWGPNIFTKAPLLLESAISSVSSALLCMLESKERFNKWGRGREVGKEEEDWKVFTEIRLSTGSRCII